MHNDNLSVWTHDHVFDHGNPIAEKGTLWVMWITAAMMVVEIMAGWWYKSMALLADGWHMSSHAVAIGLSAFAYSAARRYALDKRFAFGTWKIEVLGGFASAIFLIGVAGLMAFSSIERFFSPESIHYKEAVIIAIIGLAVNLICAFILGKAHHQPHTLAENAEASEAIIVKEQQPSQSHGHGHGHGHGSDLNLKSAYMHVLTDAATSLLAIVALLGGWLWGWSWLDPVMGIVGAILIIVWAKSLIESTGKILLDCEMDHPVVNEIREVIETPDFEGHTRVTDLHVWRVGKATYSCAVSVLTHDKSLTPTLLRDRLSIHEELAHATIEIHYCPMD